MHTGPLSDLTRYRLVSLMLGRAASPGMTVLGVDATQSADPPLLQATGLTRRHVLTHVSLQLRVGEVLGSAACSAPAAGDRESIAALPRLARAGVVSNARLDRIADTFAAPLSSSQQAAM